MLALVIWAGLALLGLFLIVISVLKALARLKREHSASRKAIDGQMKSNNMKKTVGFFHPYCNAGGGGERVLWCAIKAIHSKYKDVHCVVYTGDIDASPDQIFGLVKGRFGTDVDTSRISFVFLSTRKYVEAARYPRFTMLFQSLGSMIMGYEALCAFVPDVFIDSMGYAFTLPLFHHFGGCEIGAYVHYPTISTDMLSRVSKRESTFNNDSSVSKSVVLSSAKVLYYQIFAKIYGYAGSYAKVAMVNSTWTKNHIINIWNVPKSTHTVYPPCDTIALEQFGLKSRKKVILSVAQFRPEKDHALQLKALAKVFGNEPDLRSQVKLVMVGGCRNAGDEQRVQTLKKLCAELGLVGAVEFRLNLPFENLKQEFSSALIGIHTMKDEHFGIGVVEFMAAGCITLAHDSAGPKMDIVTPFEGKKTGYLATTADDYANAIAEILKLDDSKREEIQTAARHAVAARFSEAVFDENFLLRLEPLLPLKS